MPTAWDWKQTLLLPLNKIWFIYFFLNISFTENLPLSKGNRIYAMIFCSIVTILILYMNIIHICICVNHKKTRYRKYHNEDHNYQKYDEICTLSYHAVMNICLWNISDNQDQNMAHQHAAHISNEISVQPTDDNTSEWNADYFHNNLPQIEVYDVPGQRHHLSSSSDDTNLFNTDLLPTTVISSMENIVNCKEINEHANAEASSDQMSQNCRDSDSDTSNKVMIGNGGDGYENPYQTVLQNRPESHQYVEITKERHTSISTTDSNKNEEQSIQSG